MATPTKTTARRAISKPRLLKGLLSVITEYDLSGASLIDELIKAIETDIVKDAMK